MADFQDPLVCIVLVNWNGWPDTLDCLSSLEALRYPRFEIVLIDNGSDDDSVERIQAEYPALTLLQKDHNTGFTGGHNAGIAFALNHGAEYILLLNNDTVVDPDFLTHMVAAARADGRIGGLTPKIYFLEPRDEKVLWSAGGEVALWLARSGNRGRGQRDAGQYDALRETDYAPGCCVLMSRTAVETVGLLDDAYFAYFEDTDWSLRARAGGFKIVVVPQAEIWHAVGASSNKETGKEGKQSPFVHYLGARNQLWFIRAHASWGQKLTAYPAYFLRRMVFYTAVFVLLRRWEKLRSLWRGFRDGLRRKPALKS